MKRRLLDLVVCPACRADLTWDESSEIKEDADFGMLRCEAGHVFPIIHGIPRLLRDAAANNDDALSIQESFSREWRYFDYGRDRAWAASSDERRDAFLDQVAMRPEELEGRVVLDAGCGVGVLSTAISTFGCEVVAGDIGHQVVEAHRHYSGRSFDRTYFLQADLMQPPFRPGTFDVIYSGGVLHHTPDTRATLDGLLSALAPGGKIFVWLYHKVPGVAYEVRMGARRVIVRLPAPVKHAVIVGMLPQALARQSIRVARGRQRPETRLNAREKLITMLDTFTCRYRWEHTPDEVHGWYREHGFVDIRTTDVGKWGFGVVATKPDPARAQSTAQRSLQRA